MFSTAFRELLASDFDGGLTDSDISALTKIKINSLPTSGVLQLGGTGVTVHQEVAPADLSTLTYQPNSNFNGDDSFNWNGSDGTVIGLTSVFVKSDSNIVTATIEGGVLSAAAVATSFVLSPVSGNVTPAFTANEVFLNAYK